MGNIQGAAIPPSHIKIFNDLRSIKNPAIKVQMIQTILAGQEYIDSAKRSGIYAELLAFIAQNQSQNKNQTIRQQQTIQQQTIQQQAIQEIVTTQPKKSHIQRIEKVNSEEKAIGYFQACLEVLGLEEEVALTEDILKKAYKKSTLKNHPDKGGSEKEFEKVTRAYAYLGEILRRIHGGRSTTANVDAPNILQDSRMKDYDSVKHIEPVRLNPKKLDMDAFNKMFEQTRIPDPDEDGYGDWLGKEKDESNNPKFSGKFNRDVFNQMFEEDAKDNSSKANYIVHQPQSMIMAPTLGIELGRDRPESYTAAYNADLNFTDLKQAYTTENTFSKQVAHVRVDNRNFENYKNEYGKAPPPLSTGELERIQQGEKQMEQRELQRQRRAAEELMNSDKYFERMKQLVLTDKRVG
jgi:curved DNA-binding protein CbpA